MWFVFILGSYDSCYVGPFDEPLAAESFAVWVKHVSANFDAWRVSAQQYGADVAEYGPIEVYGPHDYRLGEPPHEFAWPGHRDSALN